jgi:hypothetical protein
MSGAPKLKRPDEGNQDVQYQRSGPNGWVDSPNKVITAM